MRILITGATGFIGSNILKKLMGDDVTHDIVITGNQTEQNISGFKGKFIEPGFEAVNWDSLGKFDVVFHQAANNTTTFLDEEEMMRANLKATKRLFESVVKNGCKRIVYASSTAIYGDVMPPYKEDGPVNPLNPYALSKLRVDEWVKDFSKDNPSVVVVGLRYCNVYGPGESHKGKRASMIYQLAQQMKEKRPRIFFDGEQKRDYIYVKDVVKANILASKAKESCIVNCGFGKATTFNKIIMILNDVLGTSWSPEYFENPIKDKYQDFTLCDMSYAREKIGFVPDYNPEQGIRDFFDNGLMDGNSIL